MPFTVMKTLLVLFILDFFPSVRSEDPRFIIPADKSELASWFDSLFAPKTALAPAKVIKVRAGGGGDFKTVTDAINSIPDGNKQRVVISICPGNYTEKITIPSSKPFITLHGDPKNMPVLVFNGTAAKFSTVDSATLTAESDHFNAVNLKIVNSAPRPDGKTEGAQAVALRVGGDAAAFYNCKIYGYQDTLFDFKGRHFYKDCYIEGTVDFIFGAARSIYMNSEINVIPGDPLAFITAQARSNDSEVTGFVFVHCSVMGKGQTAFLGRAWYPYARVVYAYTNLTDVVNPLGWSNNMRPETNRTVFFGEFQNQGPGSKLDKRVSFTKPFISLNFIEASSWLVPPLNL